MSWLYVAADGSYGSSDGLMLVDTHGWDDYETSKFAALSNVERYELAIKLGIEVEAGCEHLRVDGADGIQWCQDCGSDIEYVGNYEEDYK